MTQGAAGITNEKGRLEITSAFSTYSVDDVGKAKEFYSGTLGLKVAEEEEGLAIQIPGGGNLFLYPKEDHRPATFTVLNLEVPDIKGAVVELKNRGGQFESYDGPMTTDADGIYWGEKRNHGPNIAWFKDPAGNILSVIESKKN